MARKKSGPSFGPSQAYIVSFGDMMTALLAFFIVLCSLAEEQTGANLHSGTGSFVQTLNGFGLPGSFSSDTSKRAVSLQQPGPLYMVNDENQEPDKNAKGPDETDNGLRVIDREQEELHRFVNEMNRLSEVAKLPNVQGEVSFDFFDKISGTPPLLPSRFDNVMAQLMPLFANRDYRIDVVVWATTPSRSAWTRATKQSFTIAHEIADKCGLSPEQRQQLASRGQPWLYSDVKRPVFTIVIRRIDAS
jgi:flagellar motor protein MotB